MTKHPTIDRTVSGEPLPEPVRLTAEETKQVAGGLAAAVTRITGHCCLTCGRGTVVKAAQ